MYKTKSERVSNIPHNLVYIEFILHFVVDNLTTNTNYEHTIITHREVEGSYLSLQRGQDCLLEVERSVTKATRNTVFEFNGRHESAYVLQPNGYVGVRVND